MGPAVDQAPPPSPRNSAPIIADSPIVWGQGGDKELFEVKFQLCLIFSYLILMLSPES